MDIISMLKIAIGTVAAAVLRPYDNLGFIVFIFILYVQYKRSAGYQEIIYGKPKTSLGNLMLTSILSGVTAGMLVSILITFVGISFSQYMGIEYLIIISLVLMLIEPRFLCFSYSGGILCLAALIFGLKGIDVSGILVLVGILHLLESILIFVDGHRGAIPVFLEREDGSITGGFTMQRYWPIPLSILMLTTLSSNAATVPTPDWWPLIRPYIDPSKIREAVFGAFPVAAILGYGDFTASYQPKEKCRNTSFKLAVFSLMLLLLSIISSYIYIFKYIAALFAPIAHEYVIRREKKLEKDRKPIFSHVQNGVRVLDTIPGGAGESMGLQPGDIITAVNNRTIVTKEGLDEFFKEFVTFIWVDVRDGYGNRRTLEYKNYREGIDGLDIIYVPKDTGGLATVREKKSLLRRMLDRNRE